MIFNVGSINVDHVYRVARMPAPGETLAVRSYRRFLGGKGANQSVAITRSGGRVRHIGAIGPDGGWAAETLSRMGVDTAHLRRVEEPTGHAVIVVDDAGENQILICGGANRCLSHDQISQELAAAVPGNDWVLVQNETNLVAEMVALAKSRGLKVAYSAAPFVPEDALALLGVVDLLAVNEGEAQMLAEACGCAVADLPCAAVLITRGGDGAVLRSGGIVSEQPAFAVLASDTTGAGDTFLGAFLARYAANREARPALRYAAAASALQVTRPGAADAIPEEREVTALLDGGGG